MKEPGQQERERSRKIPMTGGIIKCLLLSIAFSPIDIKIFLCPELQAALLFVLGWHITDLYLTALIYSNLLLW